MLGIACVAGSVRHGQDHSCTHGACDLDSLLDLLVSGTQLLRTCEVRYRSRFAMQSQDERQVHQLLGLGVERPSVVRLLEVIGVALAGVEVALSNIGHAYMLPRPSEFFWGRPGPAEGRQKSVWIAEPKARTPHWPGPRRVPRISLRCTDLPPVDHLADVQTHGHRWRGVSLSVRH